MMDWCDALCVWQSKKRQYDQEVENLERQQKQTIERLEQEHTNRLRDEAKRIKAEQDKELSKYQNMLKNRKKEVSLCFPALAASFLTEPLYSGVRSTGSGWWYDGVLWVFIPVQSCK